MDISSLGMNRFNSAENPFSANTVKGIQAESSGNFEEIFRKAREVMNESKEKALAADEVSAPILKKGEIDKTSKLYEMCAELETFLLKNLIKSMRSTVQKSNLIDTGFAGGIYEDMLYDEYTKSYAKNANFGFAEMAYRDLSGIR